MRFAFLLLVLVAVALQWYSHAGGLLKTPDSCHYLAAAAGSGDYDYWPPLFPTILSVFGSVWFWMQLLLTACIGVVIIIETRKVITDPWLQLICVASILLGVHLLMIGTFLWSELLFLLLLLLFVRYLEENFIAAIILGFFLCLQRNAGIFFVIAAAIWYWDLRKSLLLFFISSSGLITWNILHPAVFEYRYFQSIPHNFLVMSDAMMKSLLPLPGFLFIVVTGVLIYFLRSDKMLIMLITYFVCMMVIFPIDPSDADRFVAVVAPFLMILVFRAIEMALAGQTSIPRKVLLILVICWLAYPFSRTLKNAIQWHNVSFTSYFCAVQS